MGINFNIEILPKEYNWGTEEIFNYQKKVFFLIIRPHLCIRNEQ